MTWTISSYAFQMLCFHCHECRGEWDTSRQEQFFRHISLAFPCILFRFSLVRNTLFCIPPGFQRKNAEIGDTNVQAMGHDAQECQRNMARTSFLLCSYFIIVYTRNSGNGTLRISCWLDTLSLYFFLMCLLLITQLLRVLVRLKSP